MDLFKSQRTFKIRTSLAEERINEILNSYTYNTLKGEQSLTDPIYDTDKFGKIFEGNIIFENPYYLTFYEKGWLGEVKLEITISSETNSSKSLITVTIKKEFHHWLLEAAAFGTVGSIISSAFPLYTLEIASILLAIYIARRVLLKHTLDSKVQEFKWILRYILK